MERNIRFRAINVDITNSLSCSGAIDDTSHRPTAEICDASKFVLDGYESGDFGPYGMGMTQLSLNRTVSIENAIFKCLLIQFNRTVLNSPMRAFSSNQAPILQGLISRRKGISVLQAATFEPFREPANPLL